jgi:hypothetical protein
LCHINGRGADLDHDRCDQNTGPGSCGEQGSKMMEIIYKNMIDHIFKETYI